jgi:hypothetical protein
VSGSPLRQSRCSDQSPTNQVAGAQLSGSDLCHALTVDTASELVLPEQIMHQLAMLTAVQGYVTRQQLSALNITGEVRRVIDTSRGIWNPRDLQATLSIVSSPLGPYGDHELDGALFRYSYRAGSLAGDNNKLRRAKDLAAANNLAAEARDQRLRRPVPRLSDR